MLTKENRIDIVGTLESIEVIKDTSIKAGAYIRGNMVVKVSLPKQMNIPISFYAGALTKTGAPRKLYTQLESLRQGQRIGIIGAIQDNKFWDNGRGQLVKTKRLGINFINVPGPTEPDRADFSYSGFVQETLKEVHNKEGQLTGYTIKLAQANYNDSRCETIAFNLDPNNSQAVNYIMKEYTSGKTVKVSGELDYDIITETREEAVDFGKPVIKTYQRNISNLMITSGTAVSDGFYEDADIKKLMAADLEDDNAVQERMKNAQKSSAAPTGNKPLAASTNTNQSLL